jgi:drug/metabolite transporter (DMT)-like permease
VSRSYLPLLLLLSALWGASFMFIKVANRDFEPSTMMLLRVGLAALMLFAVFSAQRGYRGAVREVRVLGRHAAVLGLISAALPFTLIAWGEQYIDSGVAAIGNASMPIFVALIALRYQRSESVSGLRLVGILIGIVGVGILVGVHPEGGWWGAIGTLAVVLASISYAIGSLYGQRVVESGTTGLAIATVQLIWATLFLLPLGVAQAPSTLPGWKELGSVLALAVLGTVLGQLIYYKLLQTDGSARASLVTYLLPVTALFYGVTLLGEPLTMSEIAGLVLILGGVALGSGLVRAPRAQPAAAASP